MDENKTKRSGSLPFPAAFLAFVLGFVLAGGVQHLFFHPLFNLTERKQWFRHVEFDRNLRFGCTNDFFEYLNLIAEAWPQKIPLDSAALLIERDRLQSLRGKSSQMPGLLAFIGSGTYDPPYPDPYRLPFVVLANQRRLVEVLPFMEAPGAAAGQMGSDLDRVLRAATRELPDGRVLLSPGITLRIEQGLHALAADRRLFRLQVVVWLVSGLLVGWFIRRLLTAADGSAHRGRVRLVYAAGIVLIISMFLVPQFNITRGWRFDPATLSPEQMADLRAQCHTLFERLAAAGALEHQDPASLRPLIDHPPIRP
jgi:hypothetical protein